MKEMRRLAGTALLKKQANLVNLLLTVHYGGIISQSSRIRAAMRIFYAQKSIAS